MALFYSLTNILHKFFINEVQYIFQKSYNFVFFNITWLKMTSLSTGAFYTTKIQRFGQKCQVISHYSCEYFKYIHQHNLMRIPILPSSPFLERHPQQTKRGKMQITIDITTQLTPKGCVSWLMYKQTEFGASNSNNQNMHSDLYPISHQTTGGKEVSNAYKKN